MAAALASAPCKAGPARLMALLLALLLAGGPWLAAEAVLQAETFAIGDHVTWIKSDRDVPDGNIGTVVKVMDKGVIVKFLKGQWGFKVNQLRPMSFSVGDKVTWTREDTDVPKGSIGTVMRLAGDGIVVQFPKGKWLFNPNRLRMAATTTQPVAPKEGSLDAAGLTASFAAGDHVMWANVDVDVPRGSIGTVVRVTDRAVVVKFLKGTWAFEPKQLRKVNFAKGQWVTWTNEDKDIPRGTIGLITQVGVTGVSVKFPKGEWSFNPGQLRLSHAPPSTSTTIATVTATATATTATLTGTSTTGTSTTSSSTSAPITTTSPPPPPPRTTTAAVANTSTAPAAGAAGHGTGFRVGQRVTWTKADHDVPEGSIGTVLRFKDHAVVVRFDRGHWGFDPKQLRHAEAGSEEETFCCFASRDNSNTCGTCHSSGRALSDSFCGKSRGGCHACGGAWCETDAAGDTIAHVVMRKHSDNGALQEARFGNAFQWVVATTGVFSTAAVALVVAGRRLLPRVIAAARVSAGRRGVDGCGQPLFHRDEEPEEDGIRT